MGNLPYSDIPLAVPVSSPPSPACRVPPVLAPSPDPPTPKHFPQFRQVSCFLPLENSPFSTLEPQTPCTRSACPQSRPVRASAPTPGWAMPKPFQRCRTGNSIRSAHKKAVPHPLHIPIFGAMEAIHCSDAVINKIYDSPWNCENQKERDGYRNETDAHQNG